MFGDVWNQAYNTQHSEPNIVKHRRHVCLSHAELGAGVAVVVQRLASLHTGLLNGRQKICGSVFITLSITCQFEIVYLKALCPLGKYI